MKPRILFATKNKGKIVEIKEILKGMAIEVLSLEDAGLDIDIEENGDTFEANALLKAKTIMDLTGDVVVADDSGLEIDYLDGAPGIYSARYMGENTSYLVKNQALLKLLDGVPDAKRSARFVCAIAVAFPDKPSLVARRTIEGLIGHERAGDNGFGYDPIFYVPDYGCTTAQMPQALKNQLSHRGQALRAVKGPLMAYFKDKGSESL